MHVTLRNQLSFGAITTGSSDAQHGFYAEAFGTPSMFGDAG